MSYKPKHMKDNDVIKDWNNEQEDRIESGFKDVDKSILNAYKSGFSIEWGTILKTPNNGYIGHSTEGYMSDPANAILLVNTKGYQYRDYIVNGYTVSNNNRLLQFYVFDKNGNPISEKVQLQYVVVYER